MTKKHDLREKYVSEIIESFKQILADKLISIAVIGSFARDNPKKESDIDVFIVANFEGSWMNRKSPPPIVKENEYAYSNATEILNAIKKLISP